MDILLTEQSWVMQVHTKTIMKPALFGIGFEPARFGVKFAV